MQSLIELSNKVGQFLIATSESQIHQQGAGLSKFVEFIEIVSFSLGQPRSTENTDRNFKVRILRRLFTTRCCVGAAYRR